MRYKDGEPLSPKGEPKRSPLQTTLPLKAGQGAPLELRRSQPSRKRKQTPGVYHTFFPLTFTSVRPAACAGQTISHGPDPPTLEYTRNTMSAQKSSARKEEF